MLERREKRLQMREDRLTGKVAQKIIFDDMAFADQSATIAAQAAEIVRLREVVMEVTVSLIACHSLLSRGGKRAAASNKMFEIMLSDYEKAIEVGCAALQPKEGK